MISIKLYACINGNFTGERRICRRHLGIALILILAIAVRTVYFVGFGLGDDTGYFNLIIQVLNGHWVSYGYMNQYAFRPLLLLSSAASFKLFGINEFAFILPVLLASIGSIIVAYHLGKLLFGHHAGIMAALALALYPFNVFNSVTYDNDVIIAFFMGLVMLFLFKARQMELSKQPVLYILAGFFLVIAYLFKMTALILLGVTGVITLVETVCYRKHFRQLWFYASFLLFFFMVLCFYKLQTGEFLRHFHAEKIFYDTNIPDFYLSGNFDVKQMLLHYPHYMFRQSVFGETQFFQFGLYFYLFPPALLIMLWQGADRRYGLLLLWWFFALFFWLEFMPSNWDPYYLPIPRQERYLEIVNLPLVLTVGWFLAWMGHRSPAVSVFIVVVLAATSLYNTHIRHTFVNDSIADLKHVSEWLCEQKAKKIYVDAPGLPHIYFFTYGCHADVRQFDDICKKKPAEGAYILSGGSRMYLWDPGLIRTIGDALVGYKLTPIMEYPERRTPTRKGPLKLFRFDG